MAGEDIVSLVIAAVLSTISGGVLIWLETAGRRQRLLRDVELVEGLRRIGADENVVDELIASINKRVSASRHKRSGRWCVPIVAGVAVAVLFGISLGLMTDDAAGAFGGGLMLLVILSPLLLGTALLLRG